ncbi:proteoglycan 4-like [Arachis ipaensis]|uniref:PB1-like domain-containing protein n=1 Tax=Arachis hypogaea TaxID=3818 RepID=A0A6B9VAJ3_ARAHY|nr:proteoglycan 4-like [Arachis ipaensis]XP_025678897.1 proteoglycan 4-like [Arachis hypogaea]QHN78550.1 uncharacterized protein DS421_19g662260 [Arachis hypogaea]
MDDDITIVIHYGGSFETKEDGEVVYVGDQIEQLFGLEADTLDVFSIRNYYKVLGYDNLKECWWLVPGRPLKTGLRALSHDKELLEMCFHAKNNEGVVHVYLEHGNSEHEGDEVPQLVPMTANPKIMVSGTTSNPSSCIPNTALEQNTITFPEANSVPPGQLNSAPPSQPHSKPQTKPTSNYPAQPTFEPVAQPTTTPPAQPTSTPPAQPKPMPISNPCSSKPKNNKSEKSIPPTTTKKSETSVKKNSKSTPKKGAVKKVPIPLPKRVTRSASRFAPKEKKVVGEVPSVTLSSDSSDSYESAKDELYRPGSEAFESSSDDESDSEVATARPRELKMKKNKAKGKICLEDLCEEDELIVQNSDEEVDLDQVIGKAPELQPPYDAFDAYHDDSDGNDL